MGETFPVWLGALLFAFLPLPGFSVVPNIGSHKSLLQRGSHLEEAAVKSSSGEAARGGTIPKPTSPSQFFTSGSSFKKGLQPLENPEPKGHFLTNFELKPINSIACLQAKQANPSVHCDPSNVSVPRLAKGAPWTGVLNAGNFPSYKDPICQSNGGFICDPYDVLDNETRAELASELQRLRDTAPISCGQGTHMKVDPVHYQPFYLGVVILKEWPIAQTNPDYLQQFGQLVAAQWNMDELYTGSTMPYVRCPNTGMLIVIPDNDQVYLSTESCRFVCQARGGPEVTTAALAALRGPSGAYGAALGGVKTLYAFLHKTQSPQNDRTGQLIISGNGEDGQVESATSGFAVEKNQDNWWNTVLRVLFVLALVTLLFSLAVSVLVFYLTPQLYKKTLR